ncbi:DNA-directed RNA polymerase V subunit 1-like [Hevea brasiliensis]|uniref:DNA-directed RNA polymerase V subunit 1-like n=1 Tax=Hevea brasiliensis TaxID=3981 RepID=UPI0025F43BB0|nr:DNA-directed RNA polymerase V subunit 1-like [Hevea brasiliensis]
MADRTHENSESCRDMPCGYFIQHIASYSWGKRVAVGRGSRFDLLWDQKEACFNQDGRIHVHEFLNMVRSSANGEESVTACLGTEADDLNLEG